jgi:16S rRNA (adenine1518-N6/adenine1519-N6)-dimethyltransferase
LKSLPQQVRDLQIHPKKRLGQHFVIDANVLTRIVEVASLEPEDIVLEIGAGLGFLTVPLAQKVKKVYAIEIDPKLVKVLEEKFFDQKNVEVIEKDALELDFGPLYGKWQRKMKVVANLPYEISSPIIFRLFKERSFFSVFVLMLQAEVAERTVAKCGTKDYGPLSIWSELYSQAHIVLSVHPRAFYPPPKVNSAVVKFEILTKPRIEIGDGEVLHRLIRSAFNYRRKTIANAMKFGNFSHLSEQIIYAALDSAGISPKMRGEALTVEEFRDLARALPITD